jgi:hypothetical protein
MRTIGNQASPLYRYHCMTQVIPRASTGGYLVSRPFKTLSGLSAGSPTVQQISGTVLSGGMGIATAAAAGLSLTLPIIGAAIGAVTIAIEAILNSGCGETCIETSNWANQAEQLLIQNIQEYFSIPAPRPQSAQTAAVSNGYSIINYLTQQCSNPQLGKAGQNCISDRQAGACTWKQTSTSPLLQYPGEPQPGQCWNWVNGYIDPIANDPNVVSDATYSASLPSSGGASNATSNAGSVASPNSSYLLLAAAAVLVLFGMGGNR